MSEVLRLINKAVKPIRDRVMLMVARGVVKAVSDAGGLQLLQLGLLADELRDKVERIQNYGLTSHPHPGAMAAVVFIGGNRDHGLAVAVDDRRHRPGLNEGEVRLYASFGQFVHLGDDGKLVISAPNGICIETPEEVEIRGRSIMRHASEFDGRDVAGCGEKFHHQGGTTWRDETFHIGSTVNPDPKAINPPEIP